MTAKEIDTKRVLFSAALEDGVMILSGWSEGDVTLYCAQRVGNPFATIPEDVLLSESAQITFQLELARVLIENVPPDHPPIFCARRGLGGLSAGRSLGGRLVFEHLVPGDYVIGPFEDLCAPTGGGFSSSPSSRLIKIESGAEERLQWDSNWRRVPTIEGRLVTEGIRPEELWLAPVFFEDSRLVSASAFPVRADGTYRVSGLTCEAQHADVLCETNSGESICLGTIRLGAVETIAAAFLTVDFPDEQRGAAVLITWRREESRVGSAGRMGKVQAIYDKPIRIGPLSSQTRSFRLNASHHSPALHVSLNPGENTLSAAD